MRSIFLLLVGIASAEPTKPNILFIFADDQCWETIGAIGKQNMYEHSLCPPLIINGPGIEAGKRVKSRVYIQDIVPTALELAGAKPDQQIDFESLLPHAKGETATKEMKRLNDPLLAESSP